MRLALIGAGRIGKVHARTIDLNPEVTLAAVADVHAEAAESLARQYGVRAISADAVFEDDSIDAVLIAHADPCRIPGAGRAARRCCARSRLLSTWLAPVRH